VLVRMILSCWLACLWSMTFEASAAEAPASMPGGEESAPVLIGQPAPALRLRSLDGRIIDLAAYRGKQAVYLKYWASWCTHCITQMPHFQHAYENAGKDLAVIGINAGFNDTPAAIRQVQREQGLTMPMAIDDGTVAEAFNLRFTPMHVIIDRAGIVRFLGRQADASVDAALAAVKTQATERTVEPAEPGKMRRFALGSRIPSLQVQPLDSTQPLSLPVRAGRPTVLVFTNSWCESFLAESRPEMAAKCRQSRTQLTNLPAQLQAGIDWVWIFSGLWSDETKVRKYRQTHALATASVLDADATLFNTFDVRDIPAVLLIDHIGMLRRRFVGDEKDLWQQLEGALPGQTQLR
jgi:peroxiredoxin